MKSIKLLQYSTVIITILLIVIWLICLFLAPYRIADFKETMPLFTGILLAMYGAAFAGNPLKKHIENNRMAIQSPPENVNSPEYSDYIPRDYTGIEGEDDL